MFDVNKIRNDFPMLKNNPDVVYFDSAATALKPQCVIDGVDSYYTRYTSNIHRGDYDISFVASKAYDDTRKTIQKFLNAESEKEIVFTSGDTESINTVAYGYLTRHLHKGDVILSTQLEHASSVLPVYRVCEITGAEFRFADVNPDGTFNLDKYRECFDRYNVKAVALTFVSNVLGYINPVKEICKIAHEHGAVVCIDGAQAVPHFKVDVKDLDLDFLCFSGHKMLGPSGVGVLYGKLALLDDTEPLMLGGGANARFDNAGNIILKNTPEKFEAGTPNIEGVIGLGKAAEYLMNIGMDEIHKYDADLVRYTINKIKELDNIILYNENFSSSLVTFNVRGVFAQDAATYLNKNGICVRSGNHCAKILHNVIGTTETIRASLYFYNTKEEADRLVEVLKNTTLENCIGAVI